jgi:hypothetical protein
VIFLDPWVVLVGAILAVYGLERLFVDVVRFVDRRTRPRKPKQPPPTSPIIVP